MSVQDVIGELLSAQLRFTGSLNPLADVTGKMAEAIGQLERAGGVQYSGLIQRARRIAEAAADCAVLAQECDTALANEIARLQTPS